MQPKLNAKGSLRIAWPAGLGKSGTVVRVPLGKFVPVNRAYEHVLLSLPSKVLLLRVECWKHGAPTVAYVVRSFGGRRMRTRLVTRDQVEAAEFFNGLPT